MAARKRGSARKSAKKATAKRSRTTRIEGGRGRKTGRAVRETGTPRELTRAATTTRARRATDPANNPNGIAR